MKLARSPTTSCALAIDRTFGEFLGRRRSRGDEEHRALHPGHQLEPVGIKKVVGDLHVMLERQAWPQCAGAAAVILEVAVEDLCRGIGIRPVAKRRRVHPCTQHRRCDARQCRRAHGLLGHLPGRPEVRLEVAGSAIDADDAERQCRVLNRERQRNRCSPAVPDNHQRLGITERREQSFEVARHGLEVIAGVGSITLAMPRQVHGDHPMGGNEAVGDQIPPARVARQSMEREQRGLAAGVISQREPEARRVDAVLGDGVGHVTGLWPVRPSKGPAR